MDLLEQVSDTRLLLHASAALSDLNTAGNVIIIRAVDRPDLQCAGARLLSLAEPVLDTMGVPGSLCLPCWGLPPN